MMAGCAQDRIREDSLLRMRQGDFEVAVDSLQKGLAEYPDSPTLRSGLLQSRNEALARLLSQAANERAAGQLDEAEATLTRALRFDSSGKRASSLLTEISIERRQAVALQEAETLAKSQNYGQALRTISFALKENPRQPELLTLQRRLEAMTRQRQIRASQLGLSETRPISLDFRDADLRTVLDIVTRNSGVNFILDKDIRPDIRVTVLLRSTRVEDAIDLLASTHQLVKKLIDPQTILIYPNTPEKQREYQEQVIRVFYLSSAEAKGAAAFLRSMLRVREPYVDERSNMLSIREPAETVELAERLIALYDTSEPEVLLELEVIEISTSRLTDLGIKFPDTISLTPLSPTGGSNLTLGNIRGLNADRIGLGIAGLILNLKREAGDFNTLANPRIRTRNKEKAKVLIGDKIPLITTTTGLAGFVSENVSYLDVGLKLDVEPTIYADDEVAIRVGLEVSSLGNQIKTSSGSIAYQIGTRTASTVLRLRDGETQLLAGLISNEERSASSRVPGLGDLPVAGRLFSQTQDQSRRTELMLAITPHIVRNIRRPDASESELWIGTETSPRLKAVGGITSERVNPEQTDGGLATAGTKKDGVAAANAPASREMLKTPSAPKPSASWQAPTDVNVGEIFSATLQLNSPIETRGVPVEFSYNPKLVQVVEVTEGNYFNRDGQPTSFTQSNEANSGHVRAGVLRNQASGASGQGNILSVKFRALAVGASEIRLTAISPVWLGEKGGSVALPQVARVQIK